MSGYGYNIQSSVHSITSRCYKVEYSLEYSYTAAVANCAINGGHLMNIRSSLEMGMAAYWSSATRKLWVEAKSTSSTSGYTWASYSSTAVVGLLWCRSKNLKFFFQFLIFVSILKVSQTIFVIVIWERLLMEIMVIVWTKQLRRLYIILFVNTVVKVD